MGRELAGGRYRVRPPAADGAADWRRPKDPSEFGATVAPVGKPPAAGATFARTWENLRAFFRICLRQGVRSNVKARFWRQLWRVWRDHPSRFVEYLSLGALGENFMHTLPERRKRIEGYIAYHRNLK